MAFKLVGHMFFSGKVKTGNSYIQQSYQLNAVSNGQAQPEIGYNISGASYLGGPFGSITPSGTSINGNALRAIYTTGSLGDYDLVILLNATSLLPLSHFTGVEIVELGLSLSTSTASHTWNTGDSLNDWTWQNLPFEDSFQDGQTYTVNIIL